MKSTPLATPEGYQIPTRQQLDEGTMSGRARLRERKRCIDICVSLRKSYEEDSRKPYSREYKYAAEQCANALSIAIRLIEEREL